MAYIIIMVCENLMIGNTSQEVSSIRVIIIAMTIACHIVRTHLFFNSKYEGRHRHEYIGHLTTE